MTTETHQISLTAGTNRSETSWQTAGKRELFKTASLLLEDQKGYGQTFILKRFLKRCEILMADDFTTDHVVFAIKEFVKKSRNTPVPSDLIKILSPEEPRITYAEYKHAVEQHKAEGYPAFGGYGAVIKDYQAQEREDYSDRTEEIRQIGETGGFQKLGKTDGFQKLSGNDYVLKIEDEGC